MNNVKTMDPKVNIGPTLSMARMVLMGSCLLWNSLMVTHSRSPCTNQRGLLRSRDRLSTNHSSPPPPGTRAPRRSHRPPRRSAGPRCSCWLPSCSRGRSYPCVLTRCKKLRKLLSLGSSWPYIALLGFTFSKWVLLSASISFSAIANQ